MVGRRVKPLMDPRVGEVIRWEPLSEGMCDALVRFEDGFECWHASHSLRPAPGDLLEGIPLPSRQEAREDNDRRMLAQLEGIRANHVRDLYKPWPGAEFGKGHVGKALDGAIQEVKQRMANRP